MGEAETICAEVVPSVWLRLTCGVPQRRGDLMVEAPALSFQIHVSSAFALFSLWLFTRLVHVFSVPVGYLFRPYVVY